jgi:hypothetical protein
MTTTLKSFALVLFVTVSLAALHGAARAATVNAVPGVLQDVPGITTHQTFGDKMAGMEVTALFSSGAKESVVWAATGPGAGEAKGTTWTLEEAGDTFSSLWLLSYDGGQDGLLTGLSFDGFAAGVSDHGVMFDRSFDNDGLPIGEVTPGSALGRDLFELPTLLNVFGTYSDAVGVGGNAPLEDLYRRLDIRFRGATGGPAGLDGVNLSFVEFLQDTDSPRIVPEPSTLVLFALGCLALAIRRRVRGA